MGREFVCMFFLSVFVCLSVYAFPEPVTRLDGR